MYIYQSCGILIMEICKECGQKFDNNLKWYNIKGKYEVLKNGGNWASGCGNNNYKIQSIMGTPYYVAFCNPENLLWVIREKVKSE